MRVTFHSHLADQWGEQKINQIYIFCFFIPSHKTRYFAYGGKKGAVLAPQKKPCQGKAVLCSKLPSQHLLEDLGKRPDFRAKKEIPQ